MMLHFPFTFRKYVLFNGVWISFLITYHCIINQLQQMYTENSSLFAIHIQNQYSVWHPLHRTRPP